MDSLRISTPEDARRLFDHVDAALPLVAEAMGRIGRAGSAAMNGSESPAELLDGIVKIWDQRKARKALKRARPHLDAILRMCANAETSLIAAHGRGREFGSPAWSAVDLSVTGNVLGGMVDAHIHNRLETQRLKLNGVLDEIGSLHGRLRAEYGFTSAATATDPPVPNVRSQRSALSLALWLAWCLFVVLLLWWRMTS